MDNALSIRKEMKMFQYLESLSFQQRLNIILFKSYCLDMEKITKKDVNSDNYKDCKILQDSCEDFYECIMRDVDKNIIIFRKENSFEDSFEEVIHPEGINDQSDNSDVNWPASFKESIEDSYPDSYASMPFSKPPN